MPAQSFPSSGDNLWNISEQNKVISEPHGPVIRNHFSGSTYTRHARTIFGTYWQTFFVVAFFMTCKVRFSQIKKTMITYSSYKFANYTTGRASSQKSKRNGKWKRKSITIVANFMEILLDLELRKKAKNLPMPSQPPTSSAFFDPYLASFTIRIVSGMCA